MNQKDILNMDISHDIKNLYLIKKDEYYSNHILKFKKSNN